MEAQSNGVYSNLIHRARSDFHLHLCASCPSAVEFLPAQASDPIVFAKRIRPEAVGAEMRLPANDGLGRSCLNESREAGFGNLSVDSQY